MVGWVMVADTGLIWVGVVLCCLVCSGMVDIIRSARHDRLN